ncbi:hypothetical protein [Austwickia chelonae]|uniref:hypothetical protein n=1 Tax=Austwickia chelonae TaxID=100225 RepID=UPI0013C2D798|nr:hypothetical protein [Austwickia chelonae]
MLAVPLGAWLLAWNGESGWVRIAPLAGAEAFLLICLIILALCGASLSTESSEQQNPV